MTTARLATRSPKRSRHDDLPPCRRRFGQRRPSRSQSAKSPPWILNSAATIDRQRTTVSATITRIPSGYRDTDRAGTLVILTG